MKVSLKNQFYLVTRVNWEQGDYQIESLSWLVLNFQMPVDQLPQPFAKTLEIHLETSTCFIRPIQTYSSSHSKRFWDTMLTGMNFPLVAFLECNIRELRFWSANSTANASVLCKWELYQQPQKGYPACFPSPPQKYFSFKNMFTYKSM